MKKFKIDFNSDIARVITILLGSVISTLLLTFSFLAVVSVGQNNLGGASTYLFLIFVILGCSRLMSFLKERTRTNLIRFLALLGFDLSIGILVIFGKDNPNLYTLCGGFFCVSILISRVFKLVKDHSVRSIICNVVIILFAVVMALSYFAMYGGEDVFTPVLSVCLIITFIALVEVFSGAFSNLKMKTLFKIIIRTYALEIILGIITMIVASALIFSYVEPNIYSFGDGLWYAFAVVTTIGFGDYAAETLIGRVVTVMLGIYGIIVVAVITSIIVNFYNETAGGKDAKEFKNIKKEEKDHK